MNQGGIIFDMELDYPKLPWSVKSERHGRNLDLFFVDANGKKILMNEDVMGRIRLAVNATKSFSCSKLDVWCNDDFAQDLNEYIEGLENDAELANMDLAIGKIAKLCRDGSPNLADNILRIIETLENGK